MAKLFASEQALKVAQHALELHGGNGMMLDFGVEKLVRDAAIFPHTAGKYAGPEA
jgi:alkylation response protein AidB-like acyl-CoA dehydrogenase